MKNNNRLEKLRQCFSQVIPATDARSKIAPLEYVINLIFGFVAHTNSFSLESMRRQMISQTQKKTSHGSFWERLSRKRLTNFLRLAINELLRQFGSSIIGGGNLLEQLGVVKIIVVDSTYFKLWNGSADDYPGTGTSAGIKWHTGFDILTGKLHWFEWTPGSTHDRKCFPEIESLRLSLVIVDLGYWDFNLLWEIKKRGGFFLSRIKSNSVVYITKIIAGKISQQYIGNSLLSVPIKRKRSDILEVVIEKVCEKGTWSCRAIGFWNPLNKCYYWYITNLTVAAYLIYPWYRLRWQIELIFKACKQSLKVSLLTSNTPHIIKNLLLALIAAHLASHTILDILIPQLTKMKQLAISVQRTAKITAALAGDFINFLVIGSKKTAKILFHKILLFVEEIFDPNFRHRETSLARIDRLLTERF